MKHECVRIVDDLCVRVRMCVCVCAMLSTNICNISVIYIIITIMIACDHVCRCVSISTATSDSPFHVSPYFLFSFLIVFYTPMALRLR